MTPEPAPIDPNEKLKAEYVDERADKTAWFLEVQERARLNPGTCVEHYAPNKAAERPSGACNGATTTRWRRSARSSR